MSYIFACLYLILNRALKLQKKKSQNLSKNVKVHISKTRVDFSILFVATSFIQYILLTKKLNIGKFEGGHFLQLPENYRLWLLRIEGLDMI